MIAWLLALALAAPAGTPAPEPKAAPESKAATKPARWRTSIDATTLAKSGDLNITVTLQGFDELDALCLDMPRAAASVQDLTIVGGEKLPVDPDDANCFPLPDKRPSPLVVRYRFELKSLASRTGDPDWASRGPGGDYVFNEESVLLRPEPMPLHEPREIEVVLAPGQRVAPPWTKVASARPDAAQFTTNADQYDAGSYIALGNLIFLDDVQMPVGAYGVTLLSGPVRVPHSVLRGWVATAGRAVSDFYGGVPGGRAHVILMPEPGSTDGGLFGTVLRAPMPSVALMFGAESPADAYAGNWMPFHELFHLGNPRVATKVRWFLEGSATYYQDVLRARAGVRTADEMWGDLWDGLRRFCDPMHGDSLHVESENLRHTHRWMEVYWGGACLFFRADVAIRARSNGAESLDTLLRAMRKDAEQVPLTEEQLIQRLDAAAGQPIAHTMVDTSQPLPGLAETLEFLGVHPTGPESVTFAQAPQSWIRDAIFAPDGVGRGPTSGPRSSGSPR